MEDNTHADGTDDRSDWTPHMFYDATIDAADIVERMRVGSEWEDAHDAVIAERDALRAALHALQIVWQHGAEVDHVDGCDQCAQAFEEYIALSAKLAPLTEDMLPARAVLASKDGAR